jgi:hypothetical protein
MLPDRSRQDVTHKPSVLRMSVLRAGGFSVFGQFRPTNRKETFMTRIQTEALEQALALKALEKNLTNYPVGGLLKHLLQSLSPTDAIAVITELHRLDGAK